MELELAGEVAVVVGGANGIGLAIAKAFAAEGANTVVVDCAERTVDVAGAIGKEFSVPSLGIVADVARYDQMQQAAAQIASQLGRVDHVVFAAAIGSGKYGYPFWNLTPEDWPRVIEVDLIGGVNVAHAFAPPMVEARRGTFLFLASVAGQIGSQTDPPYSAAKAGLINFAQCAAKDLAEYGVRVNVISPGMVKSALNRSVWQTWHDRQPEHRRMSYDDWAADKIARIAPLNRWQEPEDIAAAAVFLASPRAKNITGQTVNVDGGQVM